MPLLESIPQQEQAGATSEHEFTQRMVVILATILSCNIFGIIVLFFLFSIREAEISSRSCRNKTMRDKIIFQQNETKEKITHDIFDDLKMSCG
jgi:hypothetical protein